MSTTSDRPARPSEGGPSAVFIVDFSPHGLYGPFPSKALARKWAVDHAPKVAPEVRMCVVRAVTPPDRG